MDDSTLAASQLHPPALLRPPVWPPTTTANFDEIDEEYLRAILGMDCLMAAEKQELINEQLKLMKSYEDSKSKRVQVSAADAFE